MLQLKYKDFFSGRIDKIHIIAIYKSKIKNIKFQKVKNRRMK